MQASEIEKGQRVRVLPNAVAHNGDAVPQGMYDTQSKPDSDGDVGVMDDGGTFWYVHPEYLVRAGAVAVGETIGLPPCPPPGTVLQDSSGTKVFAVIESDGGTYLDATGYEAPLDWHVVLVNHGPLRVIGSVTR